ncbi:melanocortin receptor 4-like [Orbicella faveolata]|uniref:melanocortin receptor 4-like n=1 Tax=Orbicella faveolata TaxID=48498 RepID=UPI0009E5DB18|nr:melanocortin receptor 4-like [Orbicella faveolata]
MGTANLTDDGPQKTVEQLLCSAGLTTGLRGHLMFLSVLNSFLFISATLGNVLILIAFHKESSLHAPSKLLLRSLATTDLCVGLISEPVIITFWISVVNEHWNICRYALLAHFITGYTLGSASMWTLTAISVDRLLALLLGLRYRQVVTLKRTWVIVVSLWVVSTASSATWFLNSLITLRYGFILILLCLVTSIFSYTKIFFTLRHQQTQLQDHVQQLNQTNQLNIARYKKAVSSAIWLQLTLVACYLPYCIVAALWAHNGLSSSMVNAWSYAVTLGLLNSSLNPILYCWKLEEVRQEVKNTIRQVLCHCISSF